MKKPERGAIANRPVMLRANTTITTEIIHHTGEKNNRYYDDLHEADQEDDE